MTVVRTGNIATSIGNCEDTLTDDCGLLYTCRYVHMLTRRKEVERKLQSSATLPSNVSRELDFVRCTQQTSKLNQPSSGYVERNTDIGTAD
uniref:Uncharacterized protein n=1 Tax=Hyaloperonospora arabidopsidis (strain Emoy2) TaxID=559515 RepID=M4BPU2_HYAAE